MFLFTTPEAAPTPNAHGFAVRVQGQACPEAARAHARADRDEGSGAGAGHVCLGGRASAQVPRERGPQGRAERP